MSMQISFELSDQDLEHFKYQMARTREAYSELSEDETIENARALIDKVSGEEVPSFIRDRVDSLRTLIDMVGDEAWGLEDPERGRVLAALAYFADPQDIIHDSVPGLGYLDDAIMIELICRELRHELKAYEDFRKYRDTEASRRGVKPEELQREEWLQTRRQELQSDMRRRRRDARSRSGCQIPANFRPPARRIPVSLW